MVVKLHRVRHHRRVVEGHLDALIGKRGDGRRIRSRSGLSPCRDYRTMRHRHGIQGVLARHAAREGFSCMTAVAPFVMRHRHTLDDLGQHFRSGLERKVPQEGHDLLPVGGRNFGVVCDQGAVIRSISCAGTCRCIQKVPRRGAKSKLRRAVGQGPTPGAPSRTPRFAGRNGGAIGASRFFLQRFRRRSRNALAITETEDSDIAAAAIIGDRSTPKTG